MTQKSILASYTFLLLERTQSEIRIIFKTLSQIQIYFYFKKLHKLLAFLISLTILLIHVKLFMLIKISLILLCMHIYSFLPSIIVKKPH